VNVDYVIIPDRRNCFFRCRILDVGPWSTLGYITFRLVTPLVRTRHKALPVGGGDNIVRFRRILTLVYSKSQNHWVSGRDWWLSLALSSAVGRDWWLRLALSSGLGPDWWLMLALSSGVGRDWWLRLGLSNGLGPDWWLMLALSSGVGRDWWLRLGLSSGVGRDWWLRLALSNGVGRDWWLRLALSSGVGRDWWLRLALSSGEGISLTSPKEERAPISETLCFCFDTITWDGSFLRMSKHHGVSQLVDLVVD
jgi:hypothetical protein